MLANGTYTDSIDNDQIAGRADRTLDKNKIFIASVENNKIKLKEHVQTDHRVAKFDTNMPNHPLNPPKAYIGEPMMTNPNSFERVSEVLDHLCELNGLSSDPPKRKWIFQLDVMVCHTLWHAK